MIKSGAVPSATVQERVGDKVTSPHTSGFDAFIERIEGEFVYIRIDEDNGWQDLAKDCTLQHRPFLAADPVIDLNLLRRCDYFPYSEYDKTIQVHADEALRDSPEYTGE